MKPFDPRLLKYAGAARLVFGLGAVFGLARAASIVLWTWCVGQAIALVAQEAGHGIAALQQARAHGFSWQALLGGAAVALLLRALTGWALDVLAARGAVRVKMQLRRAALDSLDTRSPLANTKMPSATQATVLGRGLDALDGYFAEYVPQLILAVLATPLLLGVLLLTDLLSGVTVLLVFPVIPVFMILIGLATQAVQDRQWQQLQHLATAFLEAVSGLTTLKIYRREARQQQRIKRETAEYRRRTMQVLKVTFLSGFVLDLAGTFSIALVAVTVGTRLVAGEFSLATGLFVLLLLPEVFVPIRQVGAAFHASTEGLAAAQQVFEIIGARSSAAAKPALSAAGRATSETVNSAAKNTGADSTHSNAVLNFAGVRVQQGKKQIIAPANLQVKAGEFVALAGPSGAGKSSLLHAAMGFITPLSGTVQVPAIVSWAGQHPGLLQGSILTNLSLGDPDPQQELAARALQALGLEELELTQQLGALGAGLSGGQAQRVAIARALYRAWRLQVQALLLDEPSSALDVANEKLVVQAVRAEAQAGRAVLVVSHRTQLLAAADRVVELK